MKEYLKIRGNGLSIDKIREILLDLNKGFKEMNDNNIIHKNIKPENILLVINKLKIDKICFKMPDIGLSMNDNINITVNKNEELIAPEILKVELFSSKSEIWR